jgi:hypothetical protein
MIINTTFFWFIHIFVITAISSTLMFFSNPFV